MKNETISLKKMINRLFKNNEVKINIDKRLKEKVSPIEDFKQYEQGVLIDVDYNKIKILIKKFNGHFCSYVGIPKEHILSDMFYDNLPLSCHGGLTFSGTFPEYSTFYFFGWDYSHAGDYDYDYSGNFSYENDKKWELEEIINEAFSAVEDFEELITLAEENKNKVSVLEAEKKVLIGKVATLENELYGELVVKTERDTNYVITRAKAIELINVITDNFKAMKKNYEEAETAKNMQISDLQNQVNSLTTEKEALEDESRNKPSQSLERDMIIAHWQKEARRWNLIYRRLKGFIRENRSHNCLRLLEAFQAKERKRNHKKK